MKKVILQIILCFFVVVINLTKDLFPLGKIYAKRFACNLDITNSLDKVKDSKYLSFLDETEKQEFEVLKEFQTEYCNKYKIIKDE